MRPPPHLVVNRATFKDSRRHTHTHRHAHTAAEREEEREREREKERHRKEFQNSKDTYLNATAPTNNVVDGTRGQAKKVEPIRALEVRTR